MTKNTGAECLRVEFDRLCSTERRHDPLTIMDGSGRTVSVRSGRKYRNFFSNMYKTKLIENLMIYKTFFFLQKRVIQSFIPFQTILAISHDHMIMCPTRQSDVVTRCWPQCIFFPLFFSLQMMLSH